MSNEIFHTFPSSSRIHNTKGVSDSGQRTNLQVPSFLKNYILYVQSGYLNSEKDLSTPLFCTLVLLMSEMAIFDKELSVLFPSAVGGSRGKKQSWQKRHSCSLYSWLQNSGRCQTLLSNALIISETYFIASKCINFLNSQVSSVSLKVYQKQWFLLYTIWNKRKHRLLHSLKQNPKSAQCLCCWDYMIRNHLKYSWQPVLFLKYWKFLGSMFDEKHTACSFIPYVYLKCEI